MKKYDVIGFGALNMDRLGRVEMILRDGEFMITDEKETPGGSAANTMCWLSALGLHIAYIGCVGDDHAGSILLGDLKKYRVNTSFVKKKTGSSGTVVGIVDASGNRALYVFPGMNNLLDLSDVPDINGAAAYLHLSSFAGCNQLQLQISLVKTLGKRTNVSLAPGMLYARLGLETLMPLLAHTSIIFLNREELSLLVQQKGLAAAGKLLDVGVAMVLITAGGKGSYLITRNRKIFLPAFPATIADSVGAGDAFAAGFLYGLIKKLDPVLCLKAGSLLASYSVQATGARAGIPTEAAFMKRIKEVSV